MPNTCKLLPKWQNFAKSGHTGEDEKILLLDAKKIKIDEFREKSENIQDRVAGKQ